MMRRRMVSHRFGYGGRMAVLAQILGAVLIVAAVAVWSWPVALAVAGLLLIVGGAIAESPDEPLVRIVERDRP